jgi:hypothetical protein
MAGPFPGKTAGVIYNYADYMDQGFTSAASLYSYVHTHDWTTQDAEWEAHMQNYYNISTGFKYEKPSSHGTGKLEDDHVHDDGYWYRDFSNGTLELFFDPHPGINLSSGIGLNGDNLTAGTSTVTPVPGRSPAEMKIKIQQDAYREYGGDGSGSVRDQLIYGLNEINKWNPVAHGVDAIDGVIWGTDRHGKDQSWQETALKAFSAVTFAYSAQQQILKLLSLNSAVRGGSSWVYGAFKSEAKWAGQLSKRGWTAEQITEAVTKGKSFDAVNMVNKANSATRYVHPTTGQSVVIDNVTKELLHVGGPGFKY